MDAHALADELRSSGVELGCFAATQQPAQLTRLAMTMMPTPEASIAALSSSVLLTVAQRRARAEAKQAIYRSVPSSAPRSTRKRKATWEHAKQRVMLELHQGEREMLVPLEGLEGGSEHLQGLVERLQVAAQAAHSLFLPRGVAVAALEVA